MQRLAVAFIAGYVVTRSVEFVVTKELDKRRALRQFHEFFEETKMQMQARGVTVSDLQQIRSKYEKALIKTNGRVMSKPLHLEMEAIEDQLISRCRQGDQKVCQELQHLKPPSYKTPFINFNEKR